MRSRRLGMRTYARALVLKNVCLTTAEEWAIGNLALTPLIWKIIHQHLITSRCRMALQEETYSW